MQRITQFFAKSTKQDTFEIMCIPAPVSLPATDTGAAAANEVDCGAKPVHHGSARKLKFYSDEDKEAATKYALENGVSAALRQHPHIKRSTLRGWTSKARRAMEEAARATPIDLHAIPVDVAVVLHDGRTGNGRKLPDEVYNRVYDRVQSIRSEGLVLTRSILRREVLCAAADLQSDILRSNGGWLVCSSPMLQRLEAELSLSRRVATTAKRGTVESQEAARQLYLARMAWICNTYSVPAQLAYHMDETGVCLLPVSSRTLATKGSKVVPIVHSSEKRQVTCIVAGDLAGSLLPLQIIYGPGAKNRLPTVDGVHTTWSPNHWASTDTTKQWLMEVLVPAAMATKRQLGLSEDHHAVLTWDVYAAHRSQELREFIAEHIPWLRLVYVPANCTDFLQVADISLNLPFKRRMRQLCENWLIDSMLANSKVDTSLRSLRQQVAGWAKTAIDYVGTTNAARNGVRKAGLSLVKRQDWIFKAAALHGAGHLWSSASRNDIVAPGGSAAAAAVSIPPPPAVLVVSDDEQGDSNVKAARPKVRQYSCTFCRRKGHTKASCQKYKAWKLHLQTKANKKAVL